MSLLFSVLLSACGGGGGGTNEAGSGVNNTGNCSGDCVDDGGALTAADVETVIAQAVQQAQALNAPATIAVVDRVGNVLTVFRMSEVSSDAAVRVTTNPAGDAPIDGGLEDVELPNAVGGDALAAISKAITGAYLSSEGNAFSSRVASQIVQEHFNPGEDFQAGGPLFGVQFSQLACSDFTLALDDTSVGPKQSPLGLSADPGGFPLYKNGTAVGGVGVISSDFIYSADKDISNFDRDNDELIALAGTYGFEAPVDRRADKITVDGKLLRYSDVDYDKLTVAAEAAPPLGPGAGTALPIPGYYDPAEGVFQAGVTFGTPASGIRADSGVHYPDRDAFVFVDGSDSERFPPVAGSLLTQEEVRTIIDQALEVSNRARAQIRRPLGSQARVTVSVVDVDGSVLGMARTRDAPVFGADVALQKARTAAFYSATTAADFIESLPDAVYLNPDLSLKRTVDMSAYVQQAVTFFEDDSALRNGIAFSDRAGGNVSRPFYPDGINGAPPGPFSKPAGEWSPFSTGFQLDMVINGMLSHILFVAGLQDEDVGPNCAGIPPTFGADSEVDARVANGIQIFPGSVPIYRGNTLIGGIGVSGDGVDQDDMIAFLGVHQAAEILAGSINNAPPDIRADRLTPKGDRLRFISCPQSPFIDSDAQNVCAGK